jgi:glycosyltransferase involved in cell wall biosynthesis
VLDFSTTQLHDQSTLQLMVPAIRRDLDQSGPRVAVVIPAMDEARSLPWLARRMPRGIDEIILVDGRSKDDTVAVARSLWPGVRVLQQNRKGKGNALACGFQAVQCEITVMIDADGSMDPGEIPYFVDALRAGADYAKGSRFAQGGGSSDITRGRAIGNKMLNSITNFRYRTGYSDLCYGYNAFWTDVRSIFGLDPGSLSDDPSEKRWGDGFEVETLINIRAFNAGLRITEVPSYESPRLFGKSNLNPVRDGLRVLRTIAAEQTNGGRVDMFDRQWALERRSQPLEQASGEGVVIEMPTARLYPDVRELTTQVAEWPQGGIASAT